MSEVETLLTALLNGETVDFEAKTRIEKYLKNCCDMCGCDGLPTPVTKADALLYALAEKLASGGGGSAGSGLPAVTLSPNGIISVYCHGWDGTKIRWSLLLGGYEEVASGTSTGFDPIDVSEHFDDRGYQEGYEVEAHLYNADGTYCRLHSKFVAGEELERSGDSGSYTCPACGTSHATLEDAMNCCGERYVCPICNAEYLTWDESWECCGGIE